MTERTSDGIRRQVAIGITDPDPSPEDIALARIAGELPSTPAEEMRHNARDDTLAALAVVIATLHAAIHQRATLGAVRHRTRSFLASLDALDAAQTGQGRPTISAQ